jgi:DnaJ family protein C protein 28
MIEDVIREAMERGDFDNLRGKGKPLNLTPDPLLDPMTAIVNRILRDNGVSHPLIEARKTMERERDLTRSELQRDWSIHQGSRSEESWQEAIQTFRARVKDINRQVRIFNLKSPLSALHGLSMDADEEIRKITG